VVSLETPFGISEHLNVLVVSFTFDVNENRSFDLGVQLSELALFGFVFSSKSLALTVTIPFVAITTVINPVLHTGLGTLQSLI